MTQDAALHFRSRSSITAIDTTAQKTAAATIEKARWTVGLVVTCLYLFGVSSHWYITPDSSLYLLLAESIAAGDGYEIFNQPHTKFPPGFPLFLAGMMRLGLGDMLWLNLAMALMGLAALWLTHKLLCRLTSPDVALIATVLAGLSYEMFGASFRQLSDIPFMLLIVAGLLSHLRWMQGDGNSPELGTFALIVSCSVRLLGLPVAVVAAAMLLLKSKDGRTVRSRANSLMLLIGTGCVVGAIYQHHRQVQSTVATTSYSVEFEKASQRPLWQPLLNVYHSGGELAQAFTGQSIPKAVALILLTLPILVGLGVHVRERKLLVVLATCGYIGSLLLLRELLARYFLPVLPLLLMYWLEGAQYLMRRGMASAKLHQSVVAIAAIMLAMNLPKDIRLVHAVHSDGFQSFRKEWPPFIEVADFMRDQADLGRKFVGSKYDGVFAYLSNVPCLQLDHALADNPPRAEIAFADLPNQGVQFVIVEKKSEYRLLKHLEKHVKESASYELAFENAEFAVYCAMPAAYSRS